MAHDIDAFARIRESVDIPLMADESLSGAVTERLLLTQKAVSYFNVKLMKTGGLFAALAMIDRARRYGVGIHIGSMIESALGIQPGLLAFHLRSESVHSTDLNVFNLLAKQVCPQPEISLEGVRLPLR